MSDHDDSSPKLFDVWRLVLVRGLIEGALLLSILPLFHTDGSLALLIVGVLLGGSLVELAMARRLSGHAFQSILVFVGVCGMLIGLFILYYYFFVSGARVTLGLLVVTMELWVAVRGFAALWLGLSIAAGTFERAVPVAAGLLGLVVGFSGLLLFEPEEPTWFVRLLSAYGLVSLGVHLAVAFRVRRRGRQRVAEEVSSQEPPSQREPSRREQEARSEA